MAADTAHKDPSQAAAFVLERELAEVYLLLDHISSRNERTLEDLKKPLGDDWLERLSAIKWPPDEQSPFNAQNAAFVLKVKDQLNRYASPASGFTVAFTVLFTSEERMHEPGGLFGARRRKTADDDTPSRTSFAREAYPNLCRKAERFRGATTAINVFLLLWLLMTCAVSWYAAFGSTTLAQLAAATAAQETARKDVASVELSYTKPAPIEDGKAKTAAAAAAGMADKMTTVLGVPLCERWRALTPPGSPTPVYTDVREMQACQALDRADEEVARVRTNLNGWLDCGPIRCRYVVPWVLSFLPGKQMQDTTVAVEAPGTEYFAAIFANLLATAILPVLYAFLGSGAAIVRSLSMKTEHNLLAPRDLHLSLQRLALGAVVGACISLFVTSPGTDSKNVEGLLGTVALSTSALSFLAGFSVEAVFTALERLLNHVFNLQSPADAAAKPSPG